MFFEADLWFFVFSGENEKSVAVVKALLSKCNKKQINEADEGGRTALHIAAIQRLPMITLALIANEDTDVQKRDGKRRTALHYATENGTHLVLKVIIL